MIFFSSTPWGGLRMARRRAWAVVIAGAAGLAMAELPAEEVKFQTLSSGAMRKIGGYTPIRLELSAQKPAEAKMAPADLVAPLYGVLKLGPSDAIASFALVVDEPEGKPARLWVDANGNGDLTDDPAAKWEERRNKSSNGKELVMFSGGATVRVPYGGESKDLHIEMYRFDKHDPQREALKTTLLYYADYAMVGELPLSGRTYAAMLTDDGVRGDFRGPQAGEKGAGVQLLIDVNGDGKFDRRREGFAVNKPFNIGGTTYELAGLTASGSSLQLVKSSQTVPETKPPPDLAVGKPSLPFDAKTTDGKPVSFPGAYKGKVVMLDFWATWCGPCVGELPHLTKAYEQFHAQGLEVLGVSLDKEKWEEKLATFTEEHKMPWPQIYDGKFWRAEVAQIYDVGSIPSAFLVDGDTGVILARGQDLRGEKLAATIEKALAKKAAK